MAVTWATVGSVPDLASILECDSGLEESELAGGSRLGGSAASALVGDASALDTRLTVSLGQVPKIVTTIPTTRPSLHSSVFIEIYSQCKIIGLCKILEV